MNLNAPVIKPAHKAELELPFRPTEISNAISAMQSTKAPGPDGYPIEFYKNFSTKLTPLILEMFNDLLGTGALPQTLIEASITFIPKPRKDRTQCGSYRPISLLNSDIKILAKTLARRLESVTDEVISPDQTGFMTGRHSFSNIRGLLNVIYSPASGKVPEVVISLDAEKAFDRVEWAYLFECLRAFGFGPTFIAWIKLLYASPKASVVTNGKRSEFFSLSRGTR